MRLELGVTLHEARAQALRDLAAAAEQERLRHLTPGVGKAAEYRLKLEEAQAYQAAHRLRTPPFDAADWPMLAAELHARLSTDHQADAPAAAERILAAATRCRRALAAIAAAEGVARQRIRTAETHAEIRDALRVEWPAP